MSRLRSLAGGTLVLLGVVASTLTLVRFAEKPSRPIATNPADVYPSIEDNGEDDVDRQTQLGWG